MQITMLDKSSFCSRERIISSTVPNFGLENYHLPTRELPHNDSKRSTPSLDSASMGSTPLCLLTSGTSQLCKASSSEIGE